jgi:hypothetical protein
MAAVADANTTELPYEAPGLPNLGPFDSNAFAQAMNFCMPR